MSWLDDFLDGVDHGFNRTMDTFDNIADRGLSMGTNMLEHGAMLGLGTDLEMTRRHLDHALHKIKNRQSGAGETLTASTNPLLRAYEEHGHYLDAELKRNNALQAIAYSTNSSKTGRHYTDNANKLQTGGGMFDAPNTNMAENFYNYFKGSGVDAVYNDPEDGARVQQNHYGDEVRMYDEPPKGGNLKLKGGRTGGNLNLTDGGDYPVIGSGYHPVTGGSSLSQILGGMVYDLGNKPKKSVKRKRAKKA